MSQYATMPVSCWLLFFWLIFLLAYISSSLAISEEDDTDGRVLKWGFHPVPFGSVVYNGTHTVSLYRSVTVPTLFFHPPLGLLLHHSASSQLDTQTGTNQIVFDVEMWNDQLRKEIIRHLSEATGQSVRSFQLQIMPYDRVLLKSRRPSDIYRMTDQWLHLSPSNKVVRFTLTCTEDCGRLVEQFQSSPERFKHWRLLYSMNPAGQQQRIREVSVRSDHISRSVLAGELNRHFPPPAERVLLTTNDAQQLISKAVANVISESFDDDEAVAADSVRQVYDWIENKLQITNESIDNNWNLVYWKEPADQNRPDKLCQLLNQLLDVTGEAVETTYDQSSEKTKRFIHWNGERFVTSNDSLVVALKLDFIRSKSRAWQQQRLKVSFSQAELDLPIRIGGLVLEDQDHSEELPIKKPGNVLGRLIDGQRGLVVTLKNVYSGGYLAVDTDRNLLAINDSKSSSACAEWLLEPMWLNGVLRVRLRSVALSSEYLATGRNGSTWSRTASADNWPPVETDWILNNYFPMEGETTIDRYSVVSAQGGEYLYMSFDDGKGQTIVIETANDTTNPLGVWIDEKNQWNFHLLQI